MKTLNVNWFRKTVVLAVTTIAAYSVPAAHACLEETNLDCLERSGGWAIARDWSTGFVPGTNTNAFIGTGLTATLNSGFGFANSLKLGPRSALAVTSGAGMQSGSVDLEGAGTSLTIGADSTFQTNNLENINATDGALAGGVVTIAGTLTANNAFAIATIAAGTILNLVENGALNGPDGNALQSLGTVAEGAQLNLTLGQNLNIQSSEFTNAGHLYIDSSSVLNVTPPVIVSGKKALLDLYGNFTGANGILLKGGATAMGGGTVVVDDDEPFINDAFLAPFDDSGNPTTFTVDGDYVQESDGDLYIFIAGNGSSDSSLVDVDGSATLDGTLVINVDEGVTLTPGTTIPIMFASRRSGKFTKVIVNGTTLPVNVSYGPTEVDLTIG